MSSWPALSFRLSLSKLPRRRRAEVLPRESLGVGCPRCYLSEMPPDLWFVSLTQHTGPRKSSFSSLECLKCDSTAFCSWGGLTQLVLRLPVSFRCVAEAKGVCVFSVPPGTWPPRVMINLSFCLSCISQTHLTGPGTKRFLIRVCTD